MANSPSASIRVHPWLKKFWAPCLVLTCLALLPGCTTLRPDSDSSAAPPPPPAPREFRAVWVATVANIDWPSKPALLVAQQRAEMRAILDRAQSLHLNAIVFQVRPAADALYRSNLEPWSEYLTGAQGRAPDDPTYDPLREWIDESHRRGLELHAWFNPYRARHSSAKTPLAANHLAKAHPEAVKTYGDMLWMDPAEPAAKAQTLAVIRDIVRRYDVDGLHLDDYFYPYPIKAPSAPEVAQASPPAPSSGTSLQPVSPGATNRSTNAGGTPALPQPPPPAANLDFPDDPAWQRYLATGGKLSRADWRRQQVDDLIAEIYRSVHALKPWVRFGISPFGLGRPDRRPPGIAGFSQYDSLYADVELWLQRGWLDYLAPQLYWPIDQKAQAYGTLLDYWTSQNTAHRHLWPGLYTSSVTSTTKSWQPAEIIRQIELTRARLPGTGHIHFSMKPLMLDGQGLTTALRTGLYAEPALTPATPWLRTSAFAPRTPSLVREKLPAGSSAPRLTIRTHAWPFPFRQEPTLFAVWKKFGAQWRFSLQPAADPTIDLAPDPALGPVSSIVVSSIDRLGAESRRVTLDLTD